MKKCFLVAILSLFSPVVLACDAESTMRLDAVGTLYADADIARYVCTDNGECSIEEFSKQLEIKAISLNSEGAAAIQIEPMRKGKQYFSAIFLQDQCRYRMVFAPDTTLSSVKLLTKQRNNFYMVRGVERDSTEAWKEYDFTYDAVARQYSDPKTRCFRASGGKNTIVKCE